MSDPIQFPVLNSKPRQYVPWAFVAEHERQAQANHYQTVKRLAERGGLSWCEMLAVVMDVEYRRIRKDIDHRAHVLKRLAEWEARRS